MPHIPPICAVEWLGEAGGVLRLLDQTLLPTQVSSRDCLNLEDVREAICALRVRGAPAIGIAAAYGLVLHMQQEAADTASHFEAGRERLATSRPTAVNLVWALRRMARRFERWRQQGGPMALVPFLLE